MRKLIKRVINKFESIRIKNKIKTIYDKYKSFTMIDFILFSDNVLLCNSIDSIEGCIVECGVWRGGMIAGIYEFLDKKRKCILFDSFEGLPDVKDIDGQAAKKWQENNNGGVGLDNCKAEISFAKKAMELSRSKNHQIVQGWFDKTTANTKIDEPIAILRLDGDWYDSTMICLENLYPLVAENGVIIIDDYYTWDGCSRAVHDYLSKNNLPLRISKTRNGVCYIVNKKNGKNL
jgi:O-methyltransferase